MVARQAHNLEVVGSNPAPATSAQRAPRLTLAQRCARAFLCVFARGRHLI